MMGMGRGPRKCAMATTEGSWACTCASAPTWNTHDTGYWRQTPSPTWDSSCSRTGNSPCSASTSCAWRRCLIGASTPSRPPKWCRPSSLQSWGGGDPVRCPLHCCHSDTARHPDHIRAQVTRDRGRYAFDASRDSLQDDRTLVLTRVTTQCQQAAVALVGTLVDHRSASVRAKATTMFWEIAGAHGICPDVHYAVPEFATLAGGNWVNRIPRALAALGGRAL